MSLPAAPGGSASDSSSSKDAQSTSSAASLNCSDCEATLPASEFSFNQRKKGDERRCKPCVEKERRRRSAKEDDESDSDEADEAEETEPEDDSPDVDVAYWDSNPSESEFDREFGVSTKGSGLFNSITFPL